MKVLTVCVVAALAATAVGSAFAADPDKAVVMRDYTDTVAPAHQQAYEAGLKAYNQCLREHHVKFSEPTVTHETGKSHTEFLSEFNRQTRRSTYGRHDRNPGHQTFLHQLKTGSAAHKQYAVGQWSFASCELRTYHLIKSIVPPDILTNDVELAL